MKTLRHTRRRALAGIRTAQTCVSDVRVRVDDVEAEAWLRVLRQLASAEREAVAIVARALRRTGRRAA